jgi:uncharacterized surface protein with fasciclin (FAS1) repeats
MLKRTIAIVAVIAAVGVPISGAFAAAPSKNIVQTAVAAGKFKTLVKLVSKAGLAPTLSGKQNYTVFAPTDAAFAKVPKKTLNKLSRDKDLLTKVLLYHVVKGKLPASKVVKRDSAKTVEGARVKFKVRGKNAYVNNARVVTADVRASNGIIHVINRVLIPPGI